MNRSKTLEAEDCVWFLSRVRTRWQARPQLTSGTLRSEEPSDREQPQGSEER